MRQHTVQQGECLSSIAARYGFSDWRHIYTHPDNADFRDERPDPNVIFPGDRLVIPARTTRTESASSEQRHRFVRKGTKTLLRLQLQDEENRKLADTRYALEIAEQTLEGRSDDDGMIEVEIPADAERGRLLVWLPPRPARSDAEVLTVDYVDQADGQSAPASSSPAPSSDGEPDGQPREQMWEQTLLLGCLDPVGTIAGTQARLANLGFNPGPVDGIQGEMTEAAVRRFQRAHGLSIDGIAGPITRGELEKRHGC